MGNRLYILSFALGLLITIPAFSQNSQEKPLEKMNAKDIWIKYRTTQITEPEKWDPPKNQKQMKLLKNEYLQIQYPRCYEPFGEMDEMDPKISGSVRFERTPKCPDYDKTEPLTGSYSVGIDQSGAKKENLPMSYHSESLINKPIILNGISGYFYAFPADNTNLENTKIKLAFGVKFKCNGRVFTAGLDLTRGKESLDRIRNKDFTPPKDFKDSMSTFVCPSKKKPDASAQPN